jgi:hypothetical protein
MHKVPRGFNNLVARRSAELAEILQYHVVPIFRAEGDLPAFQGSGALLTIAGRHVLVSASHVLRSITTGVHLLLDARPGEPLSSPARVTVTGHPAIPDTLDIGWIELTPEEYRAAGPGYFIDSEAHLGPEEHAWYFRYLAVGFPDTYQWIDHTANRYQVHASSYHAPVLRASHQRTCGVDPEAALVLEFDWRRISGPTGSGGRPNLVGMSGCPIWRFNPYEAYSLAVLPTLTAFLAGPTPKNKKALFGARLSTLKRVFHADMSAQL